MRNLAVIVALFVALPLAAQQPPTPPPPTQDTPAKPTPAPAKKPAATTSEGKVVEEIVARVNNEVITRSEFEHSKVTAAEDAKNDCQNRCTPEQLNSRIEDLQ